MGIPARGGGNSLWLSLEKNTKRKTHFSARAAILDLQGAAAPDELWGTGGGRRAGRGGSEEKTERGKVSGRPRLDPSPSSQDGAAVFDALAVPSGAQTPPQSRRARLDLSGSGRYRDRFGCRKRRLRLPASPSLSLADGPPGRPRERRNKEEEEDLFRSQPSVSSFPPPPLARQTNKQHVAGKGKAGQGRHEGQLLWPEERGPVDCSVPGQRETELCGASQLNLGSGRKMARALNFPQDRRCVDGTSRAGV